MHAPEGSFYGQFAIERDYPSLLLTLEVVLMLIALPEFLFQF